MSEIRRVRPEEVMRRMSWSRATLYRRVNDGLFPPPQKDGPNISFWPSPIVDQFALKVGVLTVEESELI